jgi:hypothetical protein
MDIKLSFLSFLIGVIMKLQDDLNDNNLFEYFNILKEKDYINHFLIGVFYICLTISAFKQPVLFLGNTIYFVANMFFDKKEFDHPHEFTCLILSILLTLYLLFFENLIGNIFDVLKKIYLILCDKDKYIYYIISFIMFIIIGNYIEYSLLNTEYSYKKLILRFLFLTTNIILCVITKNILPNIIIYNLLYLIGYYLTSCIFQVILIRKDRIEKSFKNQKRKEIKKKEIKKKRIN